MTRDYVSRLIVTCFAVFQKKGVIFASEIKSYLKA